VCYVMARVVLWVTYRHFPGKYKELKKVYGEPLAEYGGLSGGAQCQGRLMWRCQRFLKVSVFPQMLWVSVFGHTLMIPYGKYPICKTTWLFLNSIEIKDLPKMDITGEEVESDDNGSPVTYTIYIQLPEKKVDFILDQVRLFQMENAAQPREKENL